MNIFITVVLHTAVAASARELLPMFRLPVLTVRPGTNRHAEQRGHLLRCQKRREPHLAQNKSNYSVCVGYFLHRVTRVQQRGHHPGSDKISDR